MADCNHNNINCGCKDSYLTTPPPCPTPEDCPERQPCSEVFDAACIIYTGPDLECGEDVVVTQNSSVTTALEDVIGYFCDLASQVPITIVEAGDGIEVTPTTVGTTTTYTVSAPCPMSVKIQQSQEVRSIEAAVTGGTGPYTYVWEMADFYGSVQSMWLLIPGISANIVQPNINPAFVEKFDTNGNINTGTIGLAKVTVTDANGCIARDTMLIIDIAPL